MHAKEDKEKQMIEQQFELTQQSSKRHKGVNFRCPCCSLTRIAKGATHEKDEWFHTGCRCTYKWLDLHGKLYFQTLERFTCSGRFKG